MLLRWLFLLHRWLGITLGLVMLLWCLSGFVMMYKPYPELDEVEVLATQEPLGSGACCTLPALPEIGYVAADRLQRAGEQILRLQTQTGAVLQYSLDSGQPVESVSAAQAQSVAAAFAAARGLGEVSFEGSINNDQWTVYGAYNPHRPLYKFAGTDAARTQWYISSRDGSIVQHTTRSERVWGFLGAVIHWLYPTQLRQHVQLWSQTVIWLTLLGSFLTLTGLYFGLKQWKKRKDGRHSPYGGLSAWHHYAGVLFGVLTLTWTFSGLFSMNPWGLLEGEGAGREQASLRGGVLTADDINHLLLAASAPAGTLAMELRPLLGSPQLFAVAADASRIRLATTTWQPEPLPPGTLAAAAQLLLPGPGVEAIELTQPDAYYYPHHEQVRLPVWRIQRPGSTLARYYLDPATGALLRKVDAAQRWNRWLFNALHRGDFSVVARSRPVWDLFMWPLLLGVSLTCGTGFFMGLRRLLRISRKTRRGTTTGGPRTVPVHIPKTLG